MNLQFTNYQHEVDQWAKHCFGPEITQDVGVRNLRFIEEAIELVQALGCTKEDTLKLVDHVYNRPVGDPPQEVGGVLVTLAALCNASHLDMEQCGKDEIARCWKAIDAIREKNKTKIGSRA